MGMRYTFMFVIFSPQFICTDSVKMPSGYNREKGYTSLQCHSLACQAGASNTSSESLPLLKPHSHFTAGQWGFSSPSAFKNHELHSR